MQFCFIFNTSLIYRIDFIYFVIMFLKLALYLNFTCFLFFRLMCRSDTEAKNMIAVEYKQSSTGEKNSKF